MPFKVQVGPQKRRQKGGGGCSTGLDSRVPIEREPGEDAARVRLGSYEFEKKGISRFDLRDPYQIAVSLTWPQFLVALLALYLSVNVVFATLYWLVPGSVRNARPNSFAGEGQVVLAASPASASRGSPPPSAAGSKARP